MGKRGKRAVLHGLTEALLELLLPQDLLLLDRHLPAVVELRQESLRFWTVITAITIRRGPPSLELGNVDAL